MSSQTYLVLIREGRLALAVATELEERLARDGHDAVALVPAVRGARARWRGAAAGRAV